MKKIGLLSIVVPVYNVAPYLEKCLESLTNQTYQKLEIVVIDDGSTDGSAQICDLFAVRDLRIKVIHKKNEGTSKARNIGVKYAQGEFIGFVDGDDYVDTDMYEKLLNKMSEAVDIVAGGRYVVYPRNSKEKNWIAYCARSECCLDNQSAMRELIKNEIFSFSVCDKVFRRCLFENLEFPIGRTCEDLPIVYELFRRSIGTKHIARPVYYNYRRCSSTSRQPFYYRRIDFVLFTRDILLCISKDYPNLIKNAEALYLKAVVIVIEDIKNSVYREKYLRIENRLRKVILNMKLRMLMNPNIDWNTMIKYINV